MSTPALKKEPYPTSTAGKIEYAQGLKLEGNAFFKELKLKKALSTYAKVFGECCILSKKPAFSLSGWVIIGYVSSFSF